MSSCQPHDPILNNMNQQNALEWLLMSSYLDVMKLEKHGSVCHKKLPSPVDLYIAPSFRPCISVFGLRKSKGHNFIKRLKQPL